MSSDALALRLSAELDELARSLAAAGPLGEDALRLLESAAVAAMHAVSLEELQHEALAPPRRRVEAPAQLRVLRAA